MFDRLTNLEDEFVSLEASLSDPAIVNDQAVLRDVSRRYKDLTPVIEAIRRRQQLIDDAVEARELLEDAEGDEREVWRAELSAIEDRLAGAEADLRILLLPKDPNDGRAVIMEIRGAEGGE